MGADRPSIPRDAFVEAVDWLRENDAEFLADEEIADGVLTAAAPKLYAHWAEGRVEAVARMFCVEASAVELAVGDQPCAVCVKAARAALGLGERT